VSRNSYFNLFVELRNKRHTTAVSSVVILVDLLLNLAGFYHC